MDPIDDFRYFKLTNLQNKMDKCTNEQFWVVTTIVAINAVFLSSDFSKEINLLKGILLMVLLTLISIYGVWFVIKRHKSFYFYRNEFAGIAKEIELQLKIQNDSILSGKPAKYSLNTLSGVIFYSSLIMISSGISITFIISSLLSISGISACQ